MYKWKAIYKMIYIARETKKKLFSRKLSINS